MAGAVERAGTRVRTTLVAFLVTAAVAACTATGEPGPPADPGTVTPGVSTSTSSTAPSPTIQSASPTPSARPPARAVNAVGGCPVFPADNIWHADVSRRPVRPDSAALVASIGRIRPVHADFGAGLWDGGPIGIPITVVPGGQPKVTVSFEYADESDRGPYPIPKSAAVEGGPASDGDRHVIVVDRGTCRAYELFAAYPQSDGSWRAGSGAVFDLRANALRPKGWTSADAAGLSILAGLVRYEEVAAGRIDHAIRITAPVTRDAFVWPARHSASDRGDSALPPMGLRLRLKSTVDISRLPRAARIIAEAMKRYGVILADNGSPWYISGAPDERWDNDALHALGTLTGADFEAVDVSGLMVSPNSAATRP